MGYSKDSRNGMLKMKFEMSETLPHLAWCARISSQDSQVIICHGDWVETGKDFFFEGAWDGVFSQSAFIDATVCMGSGGKISADGVVFASPTHTLEGLYVMRTHEGIFVSNSLAFLLVKTGDWCDIAYRSYIRDITSITKGIKHFTKTIPTLEGNAVHLYYYSNVLIRQDLSVIALEKNNPPPFLNYGDVRMFMQDVLQALKENARAPSRKRVYELLTTICSGYDSPAASVLAKEIGCVHAVTYSKARATFSDTNDSGKIIAEILGLEIIECDREAYLLRDDFPEAEFFACGNGGVDVVLGSMASLLPKKMLITGFAGQFWARGKTAISSEVIRRDASGNSIAEFRLRVGFIHVPVPYFLAVNYPSIHRISNSPDMKTWWAGNNYDKPIARRLVEEAGVPRHLFGQTKKAITQSFFSQPLEKVMSSRSFHDFMKFWNMIPHYEGARQRMFFVSMHYLFLINAWICAKISGLFGRLGVPVRINPVVSSRFKQLPTFVEFTFHWGLNKIRSRYH